MPGARSSAPDPAPLPSWSEFWARAAAFLAFGVGGIVLSLALGVAGYHWLASLGWVDALFNATMILTGMGPASAMPTDAAKLFASAYALVASLAWTALTGIILYPFIQRMLHALHLQVWGDGT